MATEPELDTLYPHFQRPPYFPGAPCQMFRPDGDSRCGERTILGAPYCPQHTADVLAHTMHTAPKFMLEFGALEMTSSFYWADSMKQALERASVLRGEPTSSTWIVFHELQADGKTRVVAEHGLELGKWINDADGEAV